MVNRFATMTETRLAKFNTSRKPRDAYRRSTTLPSRNEADYWSCPREETQGAVRTISAITGRIFDSGGHTFGMIVLRSLSSRPTREADFLIPLRSRYASNAGSWS